MTCHEVKALLNARFDDEIQGTRLVDIDSHVEGCSSCSSDLDRLKSVRQTLRGGLPRYQAPERLREQVRSAIRGAEYLEAREHRTDWRIWGSIAAGMAFCGLILTPFLVNTRDQKHFLAEELLSSHKRALLGSGVDVVSSDRHTVRPWFNGKLPFSPPVIDVGPEGFPLKGGRADYIGGRPVAALVYGRRLHRIDVFEWPAEGERLPASQFSGNGFNEVSWIRNGFAFSAVSDLNNAELTEFAGLLQRK